MWKENPLPTNCPPSKAKELNTNLYRIVKSSNPGLSDFKSYAADGSPRYKEICEAYAISFQDSFEGAKALIMKNKGKFGNFIAEYKISDGDGKGHISIFGHCNFWFYDSWELNKFEHLTINEVII